MTPSTDTLSLPVAFAMPAAASAIADIVLAACQRSMSLHAQLVDHMVGVGIEHSRQAFSDPRAALRDAMLTTSAMEPVWRYAMGLAGIGQTAVSSVTTLVTAQMRGADAEVESLSRQAREEAARSTEQAAGAAQTAMSHGLAALGRLAQTATRPATEVVTRGTSDMRSGAGSQASEAAEAAMSVIEDTVGEAGGSAGRTPQVDRSARAHAATKARAARSTAPGTPRGPAKAAPTHAGAAREGARNGRGARKTGPRG
ncbi:MAG: hypothetical protein NTW15_01370 [Burkholderiales bacterium]|nr:hypothetical protein [Burkholderiales bacterium]